MLDVEFVHSLKYIRAFSIIHKVSNVVISVLLKFENKLVSVVTHCNSNSVHHEISKSALTLIKFLIITKLFPLEVIQ